MLAATLALLLGQIVPPPLPIPRYFDIRLFGAVPDDGRFDDQAINAAVSACAAAGGGVVYLPRGRWDVNGAVNITNVNAVTLRGDGAATVIGAGGYCGPVVAVGMPETSTPAAHRPFSPLATAGPKRSVATLGQRAVVLTGHPLQLGHLSQQLQPDYWGGSAPITWDVAFSLPGGPPRDWAPIAGMADQSGAPAPWLLSWVGGGLALGLKFQDDAQWHLVQVPLTPGQAVYRVSLQIDPASGRAAAWSDGKLVTTAFTAGWGNATPPLALVPHDGVIPFMIGYASTRMDAAAASLTNVTVHGLRVSRGRVWQWDGPNQAFAGAPAQALTDDAVYFAAAPPLVPGDSLVGLLPMDPEPDGFSSPWVSAYAYRGRGVGSWCPPIGQWATSRVAVEDVRLGGGQQPTVLLGAVGDVRLSRVSTADGVLQGLGTLPLMVSYPIYLEQCNFSGRDAAVVSFWQMIESRGLQLAVIGRHGIRAVGGDGLWDGLKVWRSCPYTESLARLQGADDGLGHDFRKVLYDNEDYAPSTAMFDVQQGHYSSGRVTVDGFNASASAPNAPLFRLRGLGVGSNLKPYKVSFRGLQCGQVSVALQADGPPSFSGDIDLSLLPGATVGGAAGEIVVRPPTSLFPPPVPPPAAPG